MTQPLPEKGPYVSDLRPGERITGYYLVRSKRLEPFRDRSKGEFLALQLADRTGEVDARVWDDAAEAAEQFSEGDVVKVFADVNEYQGRTRLVVLKQRRAGDDEYDLADYQRHSRRDPDEMLAELLARVESLRQPNLKALVGRYFNDPRFLAQLERAPAARRVHHAYVGGLPEQLCEMLAVAETILGIYPEIDPDLLNSGILLHSLGKLSEYAWAGDIQYTDEGRLLGHIVLSTEQVTAAIGLDPEFPAELGLRLRHMLASQHGRYEWGSPRQPQTLEALALHQIENLTAQMSRFRNLLDAPREPGRAWTDYNRLLGRQLYMGHDEPDHDDEAAPLD